MMTEDRFEFLLSQFKADRLTEPEREEFGMAVESGKYDARLQEEFMRMAGSSDRHPRWTAGLQRQIWREIREGIGSENEADTGQSTQEQATAEGLPIPAAHTVRLRNYFRRYAAIAASVTALLTLIWMLKPAARQVAKTPVPKPAPHSGNIAPGGNRAVLTLASGTSIVLDSVGNGLIAQQSGVRIVKLGGRLTVTPRNSREHPAGETARSLYNTITTPRGGQYQLVLPDGSQVWLNSASSLKFPAAFEGKERRVELTGEGYFEVAKNPDKPFTVVAGAMKVAVLGTHFDVMAYDDEKTMNTTLLEGAVTVSDGNLVKKLIPGQQAVADPAAHRIAVGQADIPKAIAWKNGFFEFDNTDLSTIMRQLARWYDIEVDYEAAPGKAALGGSISRSLGLQEVLTMLEENGINHFKIEGRKILVLP